MLDIIRFKMSLKGQIYKKQWTPGNYIQKRYNTNIHFPENNAQTLHLPFKVEGIDFIVTTD